MDRPGDDLRVLLTGTTSGIGAVAARKLASGGATVAIVGRDETRGRRLADDLTASTAGAVRFHRADLATQSAVRRLAVEITNTYDRLDVLVHNAGLSKGERTITEDGLVANCFHPGFIPSTGLFRDAGLRTRLFAWIAAAVPRFGTTAETGADRLVELATAPEYGRRSGCYVGAEGPEEPAPVATDPEFRDESGGSAPTLSASNRGGRDG